MEREEENLETLLKWASEIGISDPTKASQSHHSCLGHSLSVSYFLNAGGRGLAASRDLRRGELVLRVPKSALMTRESLMKDERLSSALKGNSSLSPVQVDEAIWAVERAVSKADLEWKEAKALMKELNLKPRLLTFRAWLWASATISSRTLHVPWDEAGCLCPVGDLFNYAAPGEEPSCFEGQDFLKHASSLQVISSLNGDASDVFDHLGSHSQRLTDGGFEEDVDAYCFYARRHYKKGEQVLLGYGTYTNLELLEHYGFLLNKNPNEKVFIALEPEICSSTTWPKESMYIHESGKPSFALLSALRLWATPRNQRRSIAHLAYSGSQLSAENETLVMRWIFKKCSFLLKSLPTSSEADSLLLNSIDKLQDSCTLSDLKNVLPCSSVQIRTFFEAHGLQNIEVGSELLSCRKIKLAMGRWRLAIQWRLRYKEILINCISYCSELIDSLSCKTMSSEQSTSQ